MPRSPTTSRPAVAEPGPERDPGRRREPGAETAEVLEPEVAQLYARAKKIYPREVSGRFQRLRVTAAWVLLGLFYALPWLEWGGRQMVLFDLPERKFYVFGLVFWPQDFIFLAGLLIIAALSLFFFTALFGRVWCGYACPQTVWTEVFLFLERLAEGPARQRRKLAASDWSATKLRKKLTKHLLFAAFALWTGFTFVGFFSPVRELAADAWRFDLGGWEIFWILFYGLATWGNAGFLREQVCKYMCPYARFQGAMFDRDTMVVSYDERRGEPRGPRSRSADRKALGLGDCINCTLCVQVCPTGIDIRRGQQYECITCALCIDACDEVMDKMSYPRGLIRYTTLNALEGRPVRPFRPRTLVYGSLLTLLAGLWVAGIATRPELAMDVMRDRNALYRLGAGGEVENTYLLRLMNRTERPGAYRVSVRGMPGLELRGVDQPVEIPAGGVTSTPASVVFDPGAGPTPEPGHGTGVMTIEFVARALDDAEVETAEPARLLLPGARP